MRRPDACLTADRTEKVVTVLDYHMHNRERFAQVLIAGDSYGAGEPDSEHCIRLSELTIGTEVRS